MKKFLGVLLAGILILGSLVGCARAEFEVSSLVITPSEIVTGEQVTVSVEITNIGGADGVYTATLTVDGNETDTKEVEVSAGATETASFPLTRETPGTCTIQLGGLTGTLKVLTPSELADHIYQTMQEVQSYQGDMSVILDMSGEEAGEIFEMRVVMDVDFAVVYEAEQMKMILTATGEITGEPVEQVMMETYFLQDTVYTRIEAPGEPAGWQKEEAPPDFWESADVIQSQIDMLESAEINFVGTEEVDGIDCYIIEIIPTEEAFMEAMLSQPGLESLELEEILMMSGLATHMDISVTEWVARDTCFVKRLEMAMEVDILDLMLMNMEMSLNAHSYNEPITIELPPEAEGALPGEEEEEELPETVTFPDENLDATIRDALGKTAGEEITSDELAEITTLSAWLGSITDLSGLEYCTNLTDLQFSGNQISDISPLSNLTNLTFLALWDNQISDISPLSNLTSLTELWLDENQISDISPLSNLTNLTFLALWDNQISDISPLSNLTNLEILWLDGNQISDITPLVENSGLGAGDEVWLNDNNLDLSEGSEDMENIRALEDRGVTVYY